MSNFKSESVKKKSKIPHDVTLENRKNLILSGIIDVGNFDDKLITAFTDSEQLDIKGEKLNIKKLNLELGDLQVEGKISALIYKEKSCNSQKGFFSKIFK